MTAVKSPKNMIKRLLSPPHYVLVNKEPKNKVKNLVQQTSEPNPKAIALLTTKQKN